MGTYDKEQLLIDIIKKHGMLGIDDIKRKLGVSKATAGRRVQKALNSGKIKRVAWGTYGLEGPEKAETQAPKKKGVALKSPATILQGAIYRDILRYLYENGPGTCQEIALWTGSNYFTVRGRVKTLVGKGVLLKDRYDYSIADEYRNKVIDTLYLNPETAAEPVLPESLTIAADEAETVEVSEPETTDWTEKVVEEPKGFTENLIQKVEFVDHTDWQAKYFELVDKVVAFALEGKKGNDEA